MKRLTLFVVVALCGALVSLNLLEEQPVNWIQKPIIDEVELKRGDIIFQSSKSGQSYAIQLATKSKYSHVGLIEIVNGKKYVFEAVQPVTLTPLEEWVKRGDDHHYVVKRLKDTTKLIQSNLNKMYTEAQKHKGKNYDIYFNWSDNTMYCSELVWKLYKRSMNVEVGELQVLKEFDFSHPIVKAKLEERYGDNIPWDEKVISPGAIYNSELLYEVVNVN